MTGSQNSDFWKRKLNGLGQLIKALDVGQIHCFITGIHTTLKRSNDQFPRGICFSSQHDIDIEAYRILA